VLRTSDFASSISLIGSDNREMFKELYKDEVYNITKHCIIAYTDNVISETNITNG
jgi:hypothetical protein